MSNLEKYCAEQYSSGRTQRELAQELGISKSGVSRLVKRGIPFLDAPVLTRDPARPLIDRLMMRMRETSDGCWQWTGYVRNSGYAQFSYRGTNHLVHRLMYQMENGPIPDGLVIDHICRNRLCIRPEHLRAVTQSENVRCGQRWSCVAA